MRSIAILGPESARDRAFATLTLIDSRAIPSASMSSTDSSLDRALHAIADPTRRRILQALKEGEAEAKAAGQKAGAAGACLCAGDIEGRVRLSQPTISHHMAILTKAGLVESTKKGQWRWYRRDEKAIRGMVKALRGKL
jgi:DNA-binding transcriptional ArsR family regulator